MTPTAHLRFILRGRYTPTKEEVYACAEKSGSSPAAALRYLSKPGVPTLQQWWTKEYGGAHPDNEGCPGCIGEWRDVRLEAK